MRLNLLFRSRLSHISQTPVEFPKVELTSLMPKMSYGFQILGIVRAVTTMRYTISAISVHPTITAIPRFSLRSLRFWAFLWLSMRSACSGLKSVFMRGAVAPGSELGLRTKYVNGMVTIPTTVRIKKGKNCPWP